MKLLWAVFCGRGVIDRETGRVLLIDVISRLNIDLGIPFQTADIPEMVPFSLVLVTAWERIGEAKKHFVRTTMRGGRKALVTTTPAEIDLTSESGRINILTFNAVPTKYERLDFELVEIEGGEPSRKKWRTSLPIKILTPPALSSPSKSIN
jgi:hypothetical protein